MNVIVLRPCLLDRSKSTVWLYKTGYWDLYNKAKIVVITALGSYIRPMYRHRKYYAKTTEIN